jgi:hypothetical protein
MTHEQGISPYYICHILKNPVIIIFYNDICEYLISFDLRDYSTSSLSRRLGAEMKILPSGFWSTNSEPIIMEMMDEGYYAL